MQPELTDEEIELIQAKAEDDAINCIHIASAHNPHPPDDPRAEVYSAAFRSAYAREHGR